MPYVMVPVPEEHEDDVLQFLMGLQVQAAMNRWPEGALDRYLEALDDTERSIVAGIIERSRQRRIVPEADLAAATGLEPSVLSEQVQAMARRSWDANVPALVLTDKEQRVAADGGTEEYLTYHIAPAVAAEVRVHLEGTGS